MDLDLSESEDGELEKRLGAEIGIDVEDGPSYSVTVELLEAFTRVFPGPWLGKGGPIVTYRQAAGEVVHE